MSVLPRSAAQALCAAARAAQTGALRLKPMGDPIRSLRRRMKLRRSPCYVAPRHRSLVALRARQTVLASPSPREAGRGGPREIGVPILVDHLNDLLLARIDQHDLLADHQIPVLAELRIVARQFFRHRLKLKTALVRQRARW